MNLCAPRWKDAQGNEGADSKQGGKIPDDCTSLTKEEEWTTEKKEYVKEWKTDD